MRPPGCAAFERLAEVDRPEAWIELAPEGALADAARAVDARVAAGEALPAGRRAAGGQGQHRRRRVPDHRRLPGVRLPGRGHRPGGAAAASTPGRLSSARPTSTSSPPASSAPARPTGRCAGVPDPARISGGSSSGSAVAVALGVADVGVATDTAGSGRVPRPSRGSSASSPPAAWCRPPAWCRRRGPTTACRCWPARCRRRRPRCGSWSGRAPTGRRRAGRAWPADVRLAAPPAPRVAVPTDAGLAALSPAWRAAFDAAADRLGKAGAELRRSTSRPSSTPPPSCTTARWWPSGTPRSAPSWAPTPTTVDPVVGA